MWARITVDGKRAIEREFPANQRLPLGADRTIAVRAGDAGAIRLIVDGRDLGVLGKDGQVYNRTFTSGGALVLRRRASAPQLPGNADERQRADEKDGEEHAAGPGRM